MYQAWDHLRQDPDEGKPAIQRGKAAGKWEYFYIPQPKARKASKKGKPARDVP